MVEAEDPLLVSEKGHGELDGLGSAVAELDQERDSPQPETQDGKSQLALRLTGQ